MWLTNYIVKEKNKSAVNGDVKNASGNTINVDSSSQFNNIRLASPYGIAYNPPNGETAVVIPTETGNLMMGISTVIQENLQPGEVMLFSGGDAKILLNKDGKIFITGKVYINNKEIVP